MDLLFRTKQQNFPDRRSLFGLMDPYPVDCGRLLKIERDPACLPVIRPFGFNRSQCTHVCHVLGEVGKGQHMVRAGPVQHEKVDLIVFTGGRVRAGAPPVPPDGSPAFSLPEHRRYPEEGKG